MNHWALNTVPMSQHLSGVFWPPFAQCATDRRGRNLTHRSRQKRRHGDAKAEFGTKFCQRLYAAGPRLAKAEICPHHDMAQTQPFGQDLRGKVARAQTSKVFVKRQLMQDRDAKFFKPMGPRFGAHQAKGRRIGLENLPWMRLKRDHAQGGTQILGRVPREINHRGMPQMHPIEISDGRCSAARVLGKLGVIRKNPHARRLAAHATRCKMLAALQIFLLQT